MIPKFNKKLNAERSAKRLANRFPGLESMGAVKADTPGDYWPTVRVTMPGALGADEMAEINRLAVVNSPAVPRSLQPATDVRVFVAAISDAEAAEIAAAGPGPIMATESGCELLPGEPVAPLEIEAAKPIPVEQFAASFPATASSEDEIRARRKARQGAERKPRQYRLFTKKTAVLNLLAAGCTNEQIRDATGWQWHTVKGFISTMRSKGRKITTEMRDGIAFYKMEADHVRTGNAEAR